MCATVRRIIRVTALWVAATLLTGAWAAPAGAGPFDPVVDDAPGGERYVSFGDSFVSGPGIAPGRAGGCMRSTKNFPSLVAADLGVAGFTDASCGGAQTKDLTVAQSGTGNGPQLDALGPDTTLVTFGMLGGNDAGLVQLATKCVTADCTTGDDMARAAARIDAAEEPLRAGIVETKRRAPRAVVVVVGYGTYLPSSACAALQGVTDAEMVAMQGVIDQLSDTLGRVAEQTGSAFADLREIPGSLDHTPCAAPEDQWMRAINTYGDGAPMHPSAAGMRAVADHVSQVVRDTWAGLPGHPIAAGTPWTVQTSRALASTRFTRSCTGPKRRKKVRLTVAGGQDRIARVVFRVAGRVIRTDTAAPLTTRISAKKWRKVKGRVKARVTVKAGPSVRAQTFVKRRPGCLRR